MAHICHLIVTATPTPPQLIAMPALIKVYTDQG